MGDGREEVMGGKEGVMGGEGRGAGRGWEGKKG